METTWRILSSQIQSNSPPLQRIPRTSKTSGLQLLINNHPCAMWKLFKSSFILVFPCFPRCRHASKSLAVCGNVWGLGAQVAPEFFFTDGNGRKWEIHQVFWLVADRLSEIILCLYIYIILYIHNFCWVCPGFSLGNHFYLVGPLLSWLIPGVKKTTQS